MHELGLAGSILKLVEDAAQREGFRRVTSRRLEAGQLAGVETRALRFALGKAHLLNTPILVRLYA